MRCGLLQQDTSADWQAQLAGCTAQHSMAVSEFLDPRSDTTHYNKTEKNLCAVRVTVTGADSRSPGPPHRFHYFGLNCFQQTRESLLLHTICGEEWTRSFAANLQKLADNRQKHVGSKVFHNVYNAILTMYTTCCYHVTPLTTTGLGLGLPLLPSASASVDVWLATSFSVWCGTTNTFSSLACKRKCKLS